MMRKGQLFSPDFTVNPFADVEFWLERLPAFGRFGAQAGTRRLFPLLDLRLFRNVPVFFHWAG